jgi:hydroxyethylthiazole kinase-like sugar kinase family protein
MNNEVKRVAIPREVAEAIEKMRGILGANNTQAILTSVIDTGHCHGGCTKLLRTIPFDTLLAALVNGYSVEKSAEELAEEAAHNRIRNAHHRKMAEGIFEQRGQALGFADGIKFTLNELNVNITEVNA